MTSSSFINDFVTSYVLERQVANTDEVTLLATDVSPNLTMTRQYADEPLSFDTPFSLRNYVPSAPRHVANTDAFQPLSTDVLPLNLMNEFDEEEEEEDDEYDTFNENENAVLNRVTLVNGIYRHDPYMCMDLIDRYASMCLPTEEFWSHMEEAVAYCIVQPTEPIGTTYLIDEMEEIGIREGCDLRLECILRLEEKINDQICIWSRHLYVAYQWSPSFEYDVDACPNRHMSR